MRAAADSDSTLQFRNVIRAEKARAKGDHDSMVEQRRLLKQLAPGLFLEYTGRL